MHTSSLIPPAVVLVLALSACGGGPAPEATSAAPTPTTSTAPEPDAEPDPSTVPGRIQVATNSVLIYAADGSPLADFTMYEPAADVIAELTEVFGAEPAVSDSPGGTETAPSRLYDWSGFALIDYEGATIMNTDFVIDVSTATVGDISIYTYFDLQVGDPFASATAVSDYETGFPGYTAIGSVTIDPTSVGEAPGLPLAIYVGVSGSGGTISGFTAPTPNWGV